MVHLELCHLELIGHERAGGILVSLIEGAPVKLDILILNALLEDQVTRGVKTHRH